MSTEKLLKACVEYRVRLDDLERENAALREGRLCDPLLAATVGPLQAELASLCADKARLVELLQRWDKVVCDAFKAAQEFGHPNYQVTSRLICDTRAALAGKEAKP